MSKRKEHAQRAFMITHIEDQGFLLMEAYKPSKGRHYQLPGGRIDEADYEALGLPTHPERLTLDEVVRVGQHAAMRELWEETRIDMKQSYERLQFLPTVTDVVAKHKKKSGYLDLSQLHPKSSRIESSPHQEQIPRKLYYYLELAKDEFNVSNIHLSSEHIGYKLEPNLIAASKAADQHSGGDSAIALEAFEKEVSVFFVNQ